jgi:methyl-accepting chemotaxis protein
MPDHVPHHVDVTEDATTMPRTREAARAPVETVVALAIGSGFIVAAAATGGADSLVVASFAMSLFLAVAAVSSLLLRREHHARATSEQRVEGMVTALRAALGGDEDGPVVTGDQSLDRLVTAVLDQRREAVEQSIRDSVLVQEWTDCVQRLAEGDLAQDVSFAVDDELGPALALLQGRQREFAAFAGRIADGDLSVDIEAWSERDVMGFALSNMVDGLRSTVGDLRSASNDLEASSSSMTGISSEVSRGMEEVAVQTAQLAAGAESQVQVLESTRADAELAAQSATDALAVTSGGAQSVERADATMTQLAAASAEVKDAIDSLSERSSRIVDFVGMITTIADQTNLLALNAAIEAARAGEHGRGFAVVADEVRKLAEESQRSAGQISVLVSEIQTETARTVDVVERNVEQAADGTRIVAETRVAFEQINAAIDDSSRRVAGILASLEEVAAVATNASLSTEAVSAATEQTSASMQELDASAATTAQLSAALAVVAGCFRLDDPTGIDDASLDDDDHDWHAEAA